MQLRFRSLLHPDSSQPVAILKINLQILSCQNVIFISLYLNSVTRRPFISVFICGRLNEKCVFSLGLPHPLYPLPGGADQHVRPRGHELPHPGVHGDLRVLEEGHGGAAVQGAVLDLGLAGEVIRRVDRGHHPVHCEEGRQVGRVGGDQDQREEPPDPT